ncbi:MAG: hypothetical protein OXJ37_10485 [Bryobacterales bacterium]|nr:hypothetical protein [Bryobacterales bacterium]MDE0262815.1 hypothetical protein [Bryobacterales bacterium]MDE0622614.1 hypothetical protein [Bryobacterales bacterium]
MRTTLTLAPDVASLVNRMRHVRNQSLKSIINEALRQGLRMMAEPPGQSQVYRTPGVDLGRCRFGSLDDVSEVLAIADGEQFR